MSLIRFINYRSDLNSLQTRKKAKKYQLVGIDFPRMTIIKALNHKSCFSVGTCHKHVVQFAEPTPTLYWHAKRTKLTFLQMPVLNTIQ